MWGRNPLDGVRPAVRNSYGRRGRQPPLSHRVVRLHSGLIKVFPQLFEGWSRADSHLCHPFKHLAACEPSKASRPTDGPPPFSNHRQRLSCSAFWSLQRSLSFKGQHFHLTLFRKLGTVMPMILSPL